MWLQGDNGLNSTDSRHYGPVPYALLKGRAFCKARICQSVLWMTMAAERWTQREDDERSARPAVAVHPALLTAPLSHAECAMAVTAQPAECHAAAVLQVWPAWEAGWIDSRVPPRS